MRLGRTTFFYFLSQVVVSAAGFASRLAIAILLGEAILGQYAVAVALGGYWLVIPAAAVGLATTKRISEKSNPAEYWTAGVITNVVLGIAISGLILAGSYFFRTADILSDTAFGSLLTGSGKFIAALAFSAILYRTVIAGLQGHKRVALTGGLDAFERVVRTLLQVGVILLGYRLTGLLAGHISALIVVVVLSLLLFREHFARPLRRHFESLLDFGKYAWISVLQSETYGWMDVIILSFFVSNGLIGIYEAAWGLAALLGVVSSAVRKTLFPEISSLAVDEKYNEIRHILGEGVVFSGIFVIPGLVGAGIIGPRILSIYRPSFAKGETILVILILAYVAEVYGAQFASALNGLDRPDVTYRINFGFISTNIVLNIILIWKFGWIGAAVATLVSAALRGTWAFVALGREIGAPDIPIRHVGYQLLAAAIMGALIAPVANAVPRTRLWTVVVVLWGAAVYMILLLLFSSLVREKARGLLNSIRSTDMTD